MQLSTCYSQTDHGDHKQDISPFTKLVETKRNLPIQPSSNPPLPNTPSNNWPSDQTMVDDGHLLNSWS